MMLDFWHALVHIGGMDFGTTYGVWVWYNFWSGLAGSFLIGAAVYVANKWANSTCHHSPWCVRRGRYEAAGGTFRLCYKHHPDMQGRKPHHLIDGKRMYEHLHEEWKNRGTA